MLVGAIAGKGVFYYVAMLSILLVLSLSANTAFADFPRLCHSIAADGYLPSSFALRGRRLVYSQGLLALTAMAGTLLWAFGGVTDRLIPLYAVGAFLAFTLSQFGMVFHWRRKGGPAAWRGILLNGAGALVTAITVVVVLAAKFLEGAWIIALLIPALFFAMKAIRRHYDRVTREIAAPGPLDLARLAPPLTIVPIIGWNAASKKALRFACTLSPDVEAVHVETEDDDGALRRDWAANVEAPAKAAGARAPRLILVASPYRYVILPVVDHVLAAARTCEGRLVAVVIPEIVEDRWFNRFLHSQNAALLKAFLYFQGGGRVAVVNVA